MKYAKAVIGSNFGDEGKGLITDYYASEFGLDALVVRYNSSAQAGHTVCTPDSKRHIFGHFGSGSFVGSPTYLSKFFVVHPMLFVKELKTLESLGLNPIVYVDPECLITTPYDMLLNQILETSRDDKKHGSCGVGFNETIERSNFYPFQVKDLFNRNYPDSIKSIMSWIKDEYLYSRLLTQGIKHHTVKKNLLDVLYRDGVINKFIEDLEYFITHVRIMMIDDLKDFKNIIFEGAQGLLLDQDHSNFPHVTRSKTGLHNISILAKEFGLKKIDVTYVTRTYLTRHGAGPFPEEVKPYSKIVDKTNVNNKFQGDLRFSLINLDILAHSILNDINNKNNLQINHNAAITCADQIDGKVQFILNGKKHETSIGEFVSTVNVLLNCAKKCLVSFGPTRETIVMQ